MSGIVIWITGLPGSGKSTIADAVKKARPDIVILRMDDLRKLVTPEPTYSDAERDIVYRSIVFAAATIAELGHDVVIDATGNMRRWRDLARKVIPRYAEVYIKCPLEVCREREEARKDTHSAPTDIYKKGMEGWPVPGISAPYEEPLNPELIIDTESVSVDEAVLILLAMIAK
ncbi:MAG TPA: adenylyl-sulfate kinase [Dissulfurispiraceae bacterium]|nr:adenylyl-sulfate kinase [Dissulfurispiraceae bacterium]